MAVSEPSRPAPARVERRTDTWDETKSSLKTTEFWILLIVAAAVLVASTMDDDLDAQWVWGFVSALAIGYMLSRGLAKSGSRHPEEG